jgi:hypothetical protein
MFADTISRILANQNRTVFSLYFLDVYDFKILYYMFKNSLDSGGRKRGFSTQGQKFESNHRVGENVEQGKGAMDILSRFILSIYPQPGNT